MATFPGAYRVSAVSAAEENWPSGVAVFSREGSDAEIGFVDGAYEVFASDADGRFENLNDALGCFAKAGE